jgi:hypothetical protein
MAQHLDYLELQMHSTRDQIPLQTLSQLQRRVLQQRNGSCRSGIWGWHIRYIGGGHNGDGKEGDGEDIFPILPYRR